MNKKKIDSKVVEEILDKHTKHISWFTLLWDDIRPGKSKYRVVKIEDLTKVLVVVKNLKEALVNNNVIRLDKEEAEVFKNMLEESCVECSGQGGSSDDRCSICEGGRILNKLKEELDD